MKAVVLMVMTLAVFGLALSAASAGDLKVGDQAPNFKLQASDGKTYQLSDFKGKEAVVLAWFPKAFTQGCTIECKSLAEHGDLIKKYNVQLLHGQRRSARGRTRATRRSPRRRKPTSRCSAIRPRKRPTAYGVLSERGFANRWTFYIGKDGKIAAIDKEVKPATSAEDMAAQLGQLGVETRK